MKHLDHRILGEQLQIFKFNEYAPGIPFLLPKGVFLYNQLLNFIRKYYDKYDYQEIMSPLFMDSKLWEKSGHLDYFKNNMFFLEEEKYALKPMNCPAHMVLFDSLKVDKNQLPLRIADFGKLFRNENSGSLHGLARVKSFSQDDAHIFLSEDMMENELKNLISMVKEIYEHFGFKYKINLSSRPEKKCGSDEQWDQAENILRYVLKDYEYQENPGEGAFYGPKIDFEVQDYRGVYFQLGSIQLDFQLAEKFNLFYFEHNKKVRPVVIHRAILGSLERFIAILLEHYQGWIPYNFAKIQAEVLVLKNVNISHYEAEFKNLNLRYKVISEENVKQAIKNFYLNKNPYLIIIGPEEIKNNSLKIKDKNKEINVRLNELRDFLPRSI